MGVKRKSNEIMVSTLDGVSSIRSVRRLPKEKRWTEECIHWVQWAPWHRYKNAEENDGELPEGVPVDEEIKEEVKKEKVKIIQTKRRPPNDFPIGIKDAEDHGYTKGCGGCSSWYRGLGRQPHTKECRKRFEGILKETQKYKNWEARRDEWLEAEEARRIKKENKKIAKEIEKKEKDSSSP